MKTITLFVWCLAGLLLGTVVALGQNPTPISNLRRATTVYPTNVIPVVTAPGQTNGTAGVELDDLLSSLVGFPGWPSVGVTNAVATVKTNGSAVTASALTIDFVQGTNSLILATNAAGVVSIQINSSAGAYVNTNLQLQSLSVYGNQTNGGYQYFYDGVDPTMYLFNGLIGNGLWGVSELNIGAGSRALKLTSGGQLQFSGTPYGTIGNATTYGIGGIYATNAGFNSTFTRSQATNYGSIWFYDVLDPTMYLYNGLFGNGLWGVSEVNLGAGTKSVKFTGGTGAGQLSFASAPYGNIGNSSAYGIDGVYATNGGFQSLAIRGLSTNAFVWLDAGGIVRTGSVAGGLLFANGVLSISGGGGGGGLDFYQPGTAILTNISGTGAITNMNWSIIASITNVNGVSNYVGAVSNLVNTKQFGSANLTNWSNIPTGAMANVTSTTFLTNWANAISNLVGSSSGSGTNFNGILITNTVHRIIATRSTNNSISLSWGGPDVLDLYPIGTPTISFSDTPPGGRYIEKKVILALTNGQTSVTLPYAGLNGASINIASAPSTNELWFVSDGTNQWAVSNSIGYNTNQFAASGSIISGVALTNAQHWNGTVVRAASLGTTIAPRLRLTNDTAAAAGAQQISPALMWAGNGWKTTATAASQPIEAGFYLLPIQGSASPSAQLRWIYSVNGGAFVDVGPYFTTGGNFGVEGSATITTLLHDGTWRYSNPTAVIVLNVGTSTNDAVFSSSSGVVRLTNSLASATYNITGISTLAGSQGSEIILANLSTLTANTITLKNEDAASTAGFRFHCPGNADYVLKSGAYVRVMSLYDGVNYRWRVSAQ